jgi:phosphoribosylformylglycinamidine synthase
MNFEVIVQLKQEVLDPEGRAIKESLGRLGLSALRGVNVSKRFVLDIDDGVDSPEKTAEMIAHEYLANPVSETFQIRKLTP